MKIEFVAAVDAAEILAVPVFEDRTFTAAGTALDGKTNGALTKAAGKGRFTGKAGQSLSIAAPAGVEADVVLLVGVGAKDKLDDLAVEAFGGNAYAAVKLSGAEVLTIDASDLSPEQAARVGFAARLAAYRFDKYRTTQKADKIPSITAIRVVTTDLRGAEAALEPLSAVADGVIFARDLVSEPANVLYPAEFAKRVKALESLGLEVEILGEAEMEKLGMRTLLGVGQGSRRESQLAIMKWNGGEAGAQPLAFVGKGVCFDTGGISIKPADGMEDMKWDMGGAAAVTGTMIALASRKAKANVIGVLGLVENMPDGNAQRPGDVVVSMSGQTVEVINTDAEGRLVLADALWYTQERFKPKFMIDLATLTGAMIVALGLDYAGVFSNSDDVADPILAAAKKVGENFWRMPIPSIYEQHIDSKIADVKNTGNGRAGGSITAALFLQRFTNGVPWAHLDIAPTAWANKSPSPTVPEGGVGFAVRTLDRMVADSYEG
ncbi:leucyl aminopeptidase [Brevundimonas vesicularis]|uniref:Probable cytosol aminopeptidase n=1 Tax=Brevundimonas vesicularis TaxID=41276 RepID=A0A1Z3UBX0_BREVE|nr:leucyl aminopeptidase [Brevundimonas vesicularis]ASE40735.1 leucyl aminopeptidase [Brevundimonas vesicularis]MDX2336215.1 leucyl aminopeptidase [Brevundimonas vesicularis]